MKTHNLDNTTFLFYLKIDSECRRNNLNLVISHIKKYFNTNIFLVEVDFFRKLGEDFVRNHELNYQFIKDEQHIFHTTKYRNLLIRLCKTPYFFICDVDIIVNPKGIVDCIEYLKESNKPSLVYPYNGMFYNVPKKYHKEYGNDGSFESFEKYKSGYLLWFKYSLGGILGGRKEDFKRYHLDNEKIYGWGPDDIERYYRLKKAKFNIYRSNVPLYHLSHSRNENSKPAGAENMKRNKMEYLKVFNL